MYRSKATAELTLQLASLRTALCPQIIFFFHISASSFQHHSTLNLPSTRHLNLNPGILAASLPRLAHPTDLHSQHPLSPHLRPVVRTKNRIIEFISKHFPDVCHLSIIALHKPYTVVHLFWSCEPFTPVFHC